MPSPSRVERWGWIWPRWNDPRLPFATLLTLYGVLGFTFFGFNRSPAQMATIVLTGSALDAGLGWVLRREKVVPLSGYISCCSLALLLNYSHHSGLLLLLPVWLAIGSKYVLTFEGRHVFNPSMFGVATSLLLSRELITAAPAYQWANGEVALSAFIVMAALVLFLFKVGRGWLVVSFLLFYAAQTAFRAWVMRHHLPPEVLFLGTLGAPSFFIFVFYMLTDPATSPPTRRGQVLLALAIAVVDLALHFKESVYTFFYAALTCATARFLFLHARGLWRRGLGESVRGMLASGWPKRVGVVGGLGAALALSFGMAAPSPTARPLAFRMERLEAAHTGLGSRMGEVLTRVDPRVAHISKWVLSVGDAVATGDYDGDGLLDVYLSHPLKRDEDRAALYRNLGDLRFERVKVPALERFATRYTEEGLAGTATFVDYDGDGDQDLAIGVAFGPSRLLRNTLRETGRAEFEDVTEAAGVADHSVSLGLTFFDYDRDGRLDLFVTNALTTHLPDYATPPPLNLFRLPAPEYPGDRRMFRFMHDGWHQADNGGLNRLYRARGDGTFEPLDMKGLGMPETRWSLATSTVDLNHDGWTDLYVANDFGPDDVYLNEGGRHFRRVAGRLFGEVGKDTYKGMNASVADFDRNGYLDVYVSNVHHALQAEGSLLWMVGPGEDAFVPEFRDEATFRGALNERRFGWGAAAGDLDNDGWPDLVQANGMVDDRLDRLLPDGARKDYWYINHKLMQSGPEVHTYADQWGDIRGRTIYPNEARRAYLNLGEAKPGHFVDVARELGVEEPDNSRGVLMADLDNDGDQDLIVTNQHGPASVYRNTLRTGEGPGPGEAHFVGLTLVGDGVRTHRTAVGTRVVLSYEEGGRRVEQVREVGLMGGFSASADPRLHFGLGRHAGPVTATLHWYGGEMQTLSLEPDCYHEVHQPPGSTALQGKR